jgi:hypothetical protein
MQKKKKKEKGWNGPSGPAQLNRHGPTISNPNRYPILSLLPLTGGPLLSGLSLTFRSSSHNCHARSLPPRYLETKMASETDALLKSPHSLSLVSLRPPQPRCLQAPRISRRSSTFHPDADDNFCRVLRDQGCHSSIYLFPSISCTLWCTPLVWFVQQRSALNVLLSRHHRSSSVRLQTPWKTTPRPAIQTHATAELRRSPSAFFWTSKTTVATAPLTTEPPSLEFSQSPVSYPLSSTSSRWIWILRPKLDPQPKTVSPNDITPRSQSRQPPVKSGQNWFQIQFSNCCFCWIL